MDKLIVAEALDERDSLRKKITDKINKFKPIGIKNSNNVKFSLKEVETFEAGVKADYQSITDMIKRYRDINAAIARSNNTETVTVGGKTYTRAEAIALRSEHKKSSNLEEQLNGILKRYADIAAIQINDEVKLYNQRKDTQLANICGSKDTNADNIKAINDILESNKPELVDPLNIMNRETEDLDEFYRELETAIKVSNASQFIEF